MIAEGLVKGIVTDHAALGGSATLKANTDAGPHTSAKLPVGSTMMVPCRTGS